MTQPLQADYLVVGAGAMGMAFTDVLLTETDAKIVIVDQRHRPGGHWNDAYPFVRLHQPSSFYGVNSKPLGSDAVDATGWNAGLLELASSGEVCAYFDQLMQQRFLPSGRVSYFPMCSYRGDSTFASKLSGVLHRVEARKVVDATYMNVSVPAMRPPTFDVDDGVDCVPVNGLARDAGHGSYVVIGAGKTGMDACLFLLANDVDPERIHWIMPRDSWILDRANIQPGEPLGQGFVDLVEAIAGADTTEELFERVEACGQLLRLDAGVEPTMYRCATVTKAELEQLQRIRNVVRKGRVKRITEGRVELTEGVMEVPPNCLFVDCTADGLARRPVEPVFTDDRIVLQSVRTCQQVFSAAFVAHVEASYDNNTTKNELCTPVPHPDSHIDFLRCNLADALNGARWAEDEELTAWLESSRLNPFVARQEAEPEEQQRLAERARRMAENLERFLTEHDGDGGAS